MWQPSESPTSRNNEQQFASADELESSYANHALEQETLRFTNLNLQHEDAFLKELGMNRSGAEMNPTQLEIFRQALIKRGNRPLQLFMSCPKRSELPFAHLLPPSDPSVINEKHEAYKEYMNAIKHLPLNSWYFLDIVKVLEEETGFNLTSPVNGKPAVYPCEKIEAERKAGNVAPLTPEQEKYKDIALASMKVILQKRH